MINNKNKITKKMICRTGSSNKYYDIHLIDDNGKFTVVAYYGSLSGWRCNKSVKYEGEDNHLAHKTFSKIINQKENKGYEPAG